jgi:hypothetical protein
LGSDFLVGAVIEGVNEMGDRTLPLLDRRGGRDIKKIAKHRKGADGVVVQMFCSNLNNHPVCADSGCFAIFSLWHSHPSCPGGVIALIPIHSQLV